MRSWFIVLIGPVLGCGTEAPRGAYEQGLRWLEDSAFRRSVLEEALVNPANLYSKARLQDYTESEWGARAVWWPEVAAAPPGGAVPSDFLPAVPKTFDSEAELVALGAQAFDRYPVQIVPELRGALSAPGLCGLEINDQGTVEGVVWVQLPDGPQPALTCAACHAGGQGQGRANARFDLGAVIAGDCDGPSTWGPGRVDVTPDGVANATAIPDLRPVRFQRYLHRAGSVKNTPLALAVRTETLILTSLSSAVRPPRVVALGLALWMWRLGDQLEARPEASQIFEAHCAGCHEGEGLAGGLLSYDTVGTDLSILSSPSRSTGSARVPSLRGLADRGQLFSAGQAASLQAWWQAEVVVPGHVQPAEIEADRRQTLGAYLRRL